MFEKRGGEVALAEDPASRAGDAQVVFIGRLRIALDEPRGLPEEHA